MQCIRRRQQRFKKWEPVSFEHCVSQLHQLRIVAPALAVNKFMKINAMTLVTLLCCLSQALMFNKPISDVSSLNKHSCLAQALAVNKFMKINAMTLVSGHTLVLLKSDLDVQETHLASKARGGFVEHLSPT
jgi:hypothetical protein